MTITFKVDNMEVYLRDLAQIMRAHQIVDIFGAAIEYLQNNSDRSAPGKPSRYQLHMAASAALCFSFADSKKSTHIIQADVERLPPR